MNSPLSRRRFLEASAGLASGALVATHLQAAHHGSYSLKGRLYKTLKINMIKIDGPLSERFRAAKKAGFMGVEMNSPGMDV